MDAATLRAWWAHRQGLDGQLTGSSAAEVLARTGWARSVGGVGPYLTLWSRGGISRESADAAVGAVEIHELPSARGCTYVLPASDFALGLKVGQAFSGAERATALKLGVTGKEIDKLCLAIVKALKNGPLEPEHLREAVGGAARNLGPDGAKKGLITTLPVGLGALQAVGEIRRIPTNGRLDQQRYRYTLWSPNPLASCRLSADEANTELARRYFSWIGSARPAEFQWFSGLGVKAARKAMDPLGLVPLDAGSDALMRPEDRKDLESFQVPAKPHYVLVSSLDGLALLRRDLRSLLDARDLEQPAFVDRSVKPLGGLADLPSHAIIDRGRVVGLWEYDTEAGMIAWQSFVKLDRTLKQAVSECERFVRDELGDARSFSLDSPKSRVPKIQALRAGA